MTKPMGWAIMVMLFITMIGTAGPQFYRWYDQLRTKPADVGAMERDMTPEQVRTELMGKCQDSGSTRSLACRQYSEYTAKHPYTEESK
jgi:hypothetical protein